MKKRTLALALGLFAPCFAVALPLAIKFAVNTNNVLVYCPPSDAAGCDAILAAVGGGAKAYDGSNGTVDLRSADLSAYTAFVVPSLAGSAAIQPYDLLSDSAVAAHLRQAVLGRRVFWSGSPDLGSGDRVAKDGLINRLVNYAGGNFATVGAPGLVVLLDRSETGRYSWVNGVTSINLIADPAIRSYSSVRAVTSIGTEIVAGAAYANMASFGFQLPTGAAGVSLDAIGQTQTTVGGQIVLLTHPGASESQATVTTDKDDYAPFEPVVITGSGFLPGETVLLTLVEDPEVHETQTFTAYVDENGSFVFTDFSPDMHDIDVRFILVATGETSGRRAETTFTDAIIVGLNNTGHTGSSGGSALTLQAPAVSGGEILIAQVVVAEFLTGDEICTPSGWNLIARRDDGQQKVTIATYWRHAPAAAPAANYAWNFRDTCPNTTNRTRGASGGITVFTGVNTTTPIDSVKAASGISSANATAPALTTSMNDVRVLRFVGLFKNTSITPTADTIYVARSSSFKERTAAAWSANQPTAGSTNTFVTTHSSAEWVAMTVALKPAVVAATATTVNAITASASTFGGTTNLSATVTPAASGTVSFYINGSLTAIPATYNAVTGVATVANHSHGLNASATAYSVRAAFTSANTANFTNSEATNATALMVNKVTPTVTWNNPADITYPTALGATQLNATASVPGTFTYSPISGTVLNAGNNQVLSVNFAPTDGVNYNAVNGTTVQINVLKATPTVTWNNPANITYPTALGATQLNATASVPGTFTYTPISGTVLDAGNNQVLSVDFAPTDAVNYSSVLGTTVQINVLTATPTVTWNNPADITYPTALGATQLNATASVPGTFTYTPISGTVLDAGNNQVLSVDFAPTDAANYSSVLGTTVQINVLTATPTVTWNNPADITYPTALGATQLNATASVPGTFTYTPIAGTVLDAGNNQVLSVDFAPTDAANYSSVLGTTVQINVLQATPTVTWNNPADITYPAALGATQLNATASVPGTFTYTPISGTVLDAGNNQVLSVDFAPTDAANYSSVLGTTVQINVLKATPTVTWNNPADITYPAALGGTQLNALASVPGTFTYTPISGTVLNAGSNLVLSVNFAPTDAVNYNPVNGTTVQINVLRAAGSISINNIPASAAVAGSFVPAFTKLGDGAASFVTLTPAICSVSSGTVNFDNVGTCKLQASVAQGTNHFAAVGAEQTFTIAAASSNVVASVTPTTQQYSDLVTLGATVTSAAAPVTGTVQFKIDGTNVGSPVTVSGGSATLSNYAVTQAPGNRSVTAVFTSTNANIANGTSAPVTLTVTKEDALAEFSGVLFYGVPSGSAKVTLSAVITDIADGNRGDIRNATVTFTVDGVDRTGCINLPVGLVGAPTTVGSATCTTLLGYGSTGSTPYTIGIKVNGYYTSNDPANNVVLTVSQAIAGMITGGGFLVNAASSGQYPGDIGLKTNFGFNVKYNKSATNLQGNINAIVRSGGRVYQIKGNSMTSLTTKPAAGGGTATFNGKASIQDITNPLAPVAIDGNAALQVTINDKGEPGSADLMGITVWNKQGGLWFSSNWNGTKTVEATIGKGNLVVR